MLECLETMAQKRQVVSVDDAMDVIGTRSFGPALLLAGLITMAPIVGDIPGVPITMGLIVILMIGQVLFRSEHFWLPDWLLQRSISADKLTKAIGWFKRPANAIDSVLRPRFTLLVRGVAAYIIAIISILVAMTTPALEFIPFSANIAGTIWTAFGLALISRDGLLAFLAFGMTGALMYVILINL
jgi:hypothetical protein